MVGTRVIAVEMEKAVWIPDIIWRLHHQDLLIDWVWFMRT